MHNSLHKKAILLVVLIASAVVGSLAHRSESASLTSASITMSNPRLSWMAGLATNTSGSTDLIINTTPGAYPSTSSAGLQNNDEITINTRDYIIDDVVNISTISLDAGLNAGDVAAGTIAISTQSANLVARFVTVSSIPDGGTDPAIRILVPAAASNGNDGIPDVGTWDGAASAVTVDCPNDVNGGTDFDFTDPGTEAYSQSVNGGTYHVFTCPYTGTGPTGTDFTANPMTITGLINPAPGASHTIGTADAHRLLIQHLNSTPTVIDSTTVSVGVIESVRVTASVDPQLTFRIFGITAGTNCGVANGANTTAYSVPFGALSITNFTHAAQGMSISTNASNGYSVTALADDQLSKNGDGCGATTPTIGGNPECIPDAVVASMDEQTPQNWILPANKGFAYSLDDANSTVAEAFQYNSGGAYMARHFPDAQGTEPAEEIFSDTGVADNDNIFVCYKIIPDVTTEAGNYENNITYRATATF